AGCAVTIGGLIAAAPTPSALIMTNRRWLSTQRLCDGADLDAPVLDARLVAGLRRAGRAADDAAVGEPEGAAVPRADDAAVADRALQRPAHVSAGAVQGIHRSR